MGIFRFRGTESLDASSVIMTGLIALCSLGLLARAGQYTHHRSLSTLTDVGALVRDVVIAVAVATLLQYLTRSFFLAQAPPSRLATVVFVLVFMTLGVMSRVGLDGRLTQWKVAVKPFEEHSLLGVGTQNFEVYWYQQRATFLEVRQPHSQPMQFCSSRLRHCGPISPSRPRSDGSKRSGRIHTIDGEPRWMAKSPASLPVDIGPRAAFVLPEKSI